MILALVVGAAAGTGFLAAVWALVPPRTDLAGAVARFDAQRTQTRLAPPDERVGWPGRLGRWLAAQSASRGWTMPTVRANLALLDRSIEMHLVTKVLTGGLGLLLPVLVAGALRAVGFAVGWTVPALLGAALGVAFSLVPDVSVAQAADKRRDELRRALACFLDLVSMGLAGGRGAPEALPSAANIGRGWAFELIGSTVTRAGYSGVTTWDALADLGEQVAVDELRSLGNALRLVSADGAKIKESLRARAATARARQLAEAEGVAEKASQSIMRAHVLLGASFLLFLLFPATAAVMAV